MHPEFPAFAFIAAASLILPLPWHWQARNVATLSIIFWLFAMNVIYGIDAIVWANNVNQVIPVWCDITTKLIIGSTFALPAGCLCVCIHLEQVSSVRYAQATFADKKRRSIFEAIMCIGLPILFMILHFVVQGHRFDIIEEYGCRPATYYSIPAMFIVWIPPIVMAVACLVFAALALRHFMNRRASFAVHLKANNSALTASRYMRLILMSIFQMCWSLIITIYTLWYTAVAVPLRPWTTWADVHSDFGRVATVPKALMDLSSKSSTAFYFLWWTIPLSTFVFVAFFAFGKEAMDDYKKCGRWMKQNVLRMDEKKGLLESGWGSRKATNSMSLPTIAPSVTSKRSPSNASTITYPAVAKYPASYHSREGDDDDMDTTYLGTDVTHKSLPPTPTTPSPCDDQTIPHFVALDLSDRPYTYPSHHYFKRP